MIFKNSMYLLKSSDIPYLIDRLQLIYLESYYDCCINKKCQSTNQNMSLDIDDNIYLKIEHSVEDNLNFCFLFIYNDALFNDLNSKYAIKLYFINCHIVSVLNSNEILPYKRQDDKKYEYINSDYSKIKYPNKLILSKCKEILQQKADAGYMLHKVGLLPFTEHDLYDDSNKEIVLLGNCSINRVWYDTAESVEEDFDVSSDTPISLTSYNKIKCPSKSTLSKCKKILQQKEDKGYLLQRFMRKPFTENSLNGEYMNQDNVEIVLLGNCSINREWADTAESIDLESENYEEASVEEDFDVRSDARIYSTSTSIDLESENYEEALYCR